jgi:hypothetical protein
MGSGAVLFHTDFTRAALQFHRIPIKCRYQIKGGRDYVFRFGMVLVACYSGGSGGLHPIQGKVYEMVEQTGAGKEKGATWKMG